MNNREKKMNKTENHILDQTEINYVLNETFTQTIVMSAHKAIKISVNRYGDTYFNVYKNEILIDKFSFLGDAIKKYNCI